jgi:acyl carrier protein
MTTRARLIAFIKDSLARGSNVEIAEDTRLIDRGLIDSIGLMELVAFIEGDTGIRIPDDEVYPENFQTIENVEAMIERLRTDAGVR